MITIGFAGRSIRSQVVSTDETRSAFDIAGHLLRAQNSEIEIRSYRATLGHSARIFTGCDARYLRKYITKEND